MTVRLALINDKCFAAFVSVNYPFETRSTAAAVHLSTRMRYCVALRPTTVLELLDVVASQLVCGAAIVGDMMR